MIDDAHNGLNKLSLLVMICTVRHCWTAEERFSFNFYNHWAQLLLCQPGDQTFTLLSREGITCGDPLFMVLYGIILVPLEEDIRAEDLRLVPPFYADDAAFDGSE